MSKSLTVLAILGALSGQALAQDDWDIWETESGADVAVAASGAKDAPVTWAAAWNLSTNRVLDNGLEIGAVGRFELQHDNPRRAGFSGVTASDVGLGQGAFSGLARGPGDDRVGTRAQLEQAYIYAEGGYGELRLGRDEGVATRFYEGAPSIFLKASAANPVLDPTGRAYIRTDHDLTGPALKVSYASPRILGVRAGVSYTPTADVRGLDRDPERRLAGNPQINVDSAAEAAINVSRRLRESGVRVRGALAYSRADVNSALRPDIYGTVQTWSAGASAEFETIAIGASVLGSNNGLDSGSGDYSAWVIGATKQAFSLDFGIDYGEATDDLTGLTSESWSIGAARELREGLRVSGGYRSQTTRIERVLPLGAPYNEDSADGIVLEITLSL